MRQGECHCGSVRFTMPDRAVHATICHCADCRRQSGAPLLAWAMVSTADLTIDGEVRAYRSSDSGERSFCPACGTGLFFTNAPLRAMAMTQVRIAALDDPDAVAPLMQVQVAERIGWMADAHALPAFDRFPG
jgi:hypothetical protein